ncbi:MAG: metal-dependent hydrolase [Gemmatimonadales bacterium]
MDPICHTLVGATLARTGFSRRTALGTATLLIGANLPDIDILAYFDGPAADLSFRRGWTHGIPALLVLPFLLTALVVGFDHLVRRMGRATLPSGVVPAQVLLLAAVAVLTHPMLDALNTYGVRWLMPFNGRWFYGDTLFIVDPWLWLILGIGFLWSGYRRRIRRLSEWTSRPAIVALQVSAGYIAVMALSGLIARTITVRELRGVTGENVEALMVGPVPFTPFVRSVVAAQKNSYRATEFRWLRRPHLDVASLRSYPRSRPQSAAVDAAAATPVGKRFLRWARFPVFEEEAGAEGSTLVHMIDLRYADRPGKGFGTVTIPVAASPASGSSSDSLSAYPPAGHAAPRH